MIISQILWMLRSLRRPLERCQDKKLLIYFYPPIRNRMFAKHNCKNIERASTIWFVFCLNSTILHFSEGFKTSLQFSRLGYGIIPCLFYKARNNTWGIGNQDFERNLLICRQHLMRRYLLFRAAGWIHPKLISLYISSKT